MTFYVIEQLGGEWGATPQIYSDPETYKKCVEEMRDTDWDNFPSGDEMTIAEIKSRLELNDYFALSLEMAEVTPDEMEILETALDAE